MTPRGYYRHWGLRAGVVRAAEQREHPRCQRLRVWSASLADTARARADLLVVRQNHQRAHHLRQPDRCVRLAIEQ